MYYVQTVVVQGRSQDFVEWGKMFCEQVEWRVSYLDDFFTASPSDFVLGVFGALPFALVTSRGFILRSYKKFEILLEKTTHLTFTIVYFTIIL